jgi:hypothetical protein
LIVCEGKIFQIYQTPSLFVSFLRFLYVISLAPNPTLVRSPPSGSFTLVHRARKVEKNICKAFIFRSLVHTHSCFLPPSPSTLLVVGTLCITILHKKNHPVLLHIKARNATSSHGSKKERKAHEDCKNVY